MTHSSPLNPNSGGPLPVNTSPLVWQPPVATAQGPRKSRGRAAAEEEIKDATLHCGHSIVPLHCKGRIRLLLRPCIASRLPSVAKFGRIVRPNFVLAAEGSPFPLRRRVLPARQCNGLCRKPVRSKEPAMDQVTALAQAFNMISALARELSDIRAHDALTDRQHIASHVRLDGLARKAGELADELSQLMPWPQADDAGA